MLKLSAVVAIIASLAMASVKLALGETLWWPFAIIEYLAAGVLFAGATLALRTRQGALLAAGWGLTAGITWSTLFHHLQRNGSFSSLELALAGLLAGAIVGAAIVVYAEHAHRAQEQNASLAEVGAK